MPGRGPAPKDRSQRVNQHNAARGEIQYATTVGWQHGPVPKPPPSLKPASREAWDIWFAAWFSYFWTPEDVPALRQLIRLYDQVERGEFQRHGELRLAMDTYGVTPKGQQDRRWRPPREDSPSSSSASRKAVGSYEHLKVVPT